MPRSLAATLVLAALTLGITVGFDTATFAHSGNHSNMSFAELATHLSASWDHRFTIVAVGVALALTAVSAVLIGKKRTR